MPELTQRISNETLLFLSLTASIAIPSCTERGDLTRNQSLYVTMRDGVKIAIDVWLPEGLREGEKIPTIMRATRYWRAADIVDGSLGAR